MSNDNDALMKAIEHLEAAYEYKEASNLNAALAECDTAIEIIEAALTSDEPVDSDVNEVLGETHCLRGDVLQKMGQLQDAAYAYETALDLFPDLSEARINLAKLRDNSPNSLNLVTIASFSQALEAQVARGRLEASGIAAFVANENTVGANWLYSNAVGGVKLQVSANNVETALELLDSVQAEAMPEVVEDTQDIDLVCPRCGAESVTFEKYNRRGVFAAWALLGFPLPLTKNSWKCQSCGYSWKDEQTAP